VNDAELKAALKRAVDAQDFEAADFFYNQLESMPKAQPQAATPAPQEQKPAFSASTYFDQPAGDILKDQLSGAGNMIGNFPGSLYNAAKGMVNTVAHPVDSAMSINDLIKGAGVNILKALPEPLQSDNDAGWIAENQASEPTADAYGAMMADRYGGIENIRNTIQNDPAGAMLDASAVTGLLGGGAQLAGLGKTADVLSKTSAAINPINATLNAGKVAGAKLMPKGLPQGLYESSVKFGTTVEDRPRLIQRALDEKLMPTEAGLDKLATKISSAQTDIIALINNASAGGVKIPKGAILKGIKQLKDTYRGTPDGAQSIKEIDALSRQFLVSDLGNKSYLTPSDLQKWKVKAYDKINYNAKRNVAAPVKEEVLKTSARAAKEKIEDVVPGADIRAMNARQGEMLELQAPLLRATNRIGNRNIISIDTPLKVGTGSILGQALDSAVPGSGMLIGAGIGAGASILGNPKIKAGIAIGLNDLKKTGDIGAFIRNNPHLSQAEIAAYLANSANSASQQQAR